MSCIFELEDGSKVIARPSGTEPKIKFYFMVVDRQGIPLSDRAEVRRRVAACEEKQQRLVDAIAKMVTEHSAA